jgi:hypothetical protein
VRRAVLCSHKATPCLLSPLSPLYDEINIIFPNHSNPDRFHLAVKYFLSGEL